MRRCHDGDGLGLATRDRLRRWRPRLRQDTCVGSGDTASPVTAGLHARPAGRGAASAWPILNHVQRWFLMVFRPRPSGSSSSLKRVKPRDPGKSENAWFLRGTHPGGWAPFEFLKMHLYQYTQKIEHCSNKFDFLPLFCLEGLVPNSVLSGSRGVHARTELVLQGSRTGRIPPRPINCANQRPVNCPNN